MQENIYKVVSCFGHWDTEDSEELRSKIRNQFEDWIVNHKVGIFFFGGFGNFDYFCHEVITQLKVKYPFIKRIFCLADERHLRINKRPSYLKDEDYEEFVYLSISYPGWYKRIYFRNCEMINQSDYILFCVEEREGSGAYKTYKHALKMKKEIVNIF